MYFSCCSNPWVWGGWGDETKHRMCSSYSEPWRWTSDGLRCFKGGRSGDTIFLFYISLGMMVHDGDPKHSSKLWQMYFQLSFCCESALLWWREAAGQFDAACIQTLAFIKLHLRCISSHYTSKPASYKQSSVSFHEMNPTYSSPPNNSVSY